MKLIKENATVQKINARKITRGNIEHDKGVCHSDKESLLDKKLRTKIQLPVRVI